MPAPFWLVWSPTGHNPQHQHATERSAVDEAERLARQVPDTTFIVLRAVSRSIVKVPHITEKFDDPRLPF